VGLWCFYEVLVKEKGMGGDKCQAGESESLLKIDILLRRAQGGTTCWFRCNQQTAERNFKESFEGGNQKTLFI
jgi:hypothetical protein